MFRFFLPIIFSVCCVQAGLVCAKEQLDIFVSIPPQKYLVERIGKEHVNVRAMLRPGDSPETFDPGPRKLVELESAQLYFQIGIPFETVWIDTIRKRNNKIEVVECCENILGSKSLEYDNHVWTSPRNALVIAEQIKNKLIAYDKKNLADYEKNYQSLAADLKQLDADIINALSSRRTSYFIMSHASLSYYAEHYGLTQLSLEKNGKQLGAKSLGKIVEMARRENINTLFVQKQHHSSSEEIFVDELGVRVVEIDPLVEDYIEGLNKLTRVIAQAIN